MAQIIKFASDIDGTEFNTLSEQRAYDAGKRNEGRIYAFLDANYPVPAVGKAGPSRAIIAKALALWLGEESAEVEAQGSLLAD